MNQDLKIKLRPGKEDAIRRFHPWVFSGAIMSIEGNQYDGAIAQVFDSKGNYLASGIFQDATIMVRILEFAPNKISAPDKHFWAQKINRALEARKLSGIANSKETNVFRLVHGEGDHLPGLIIDFFDNNIVIQAHATGMHAHVDEIAQGLQIVFGKGLKSITDKSGDTLPQSYLETISMKKSLYGNAGKVQVKENGYTFMVDVNEGQKTGFYIDQRENRTLLAKYCQNKKVLNTFCYSGGFSVYALGAGADVVHSVDSSKKAIELCKENVELNFGDDSRNLCITSDTMQYLKQLDETYDVVVLDPPAYAKHLKARHNAVQGYKRLNLEALKKMNAGGVLFTFSCSQIVDMNLFRGAVLAASIEAKKKVRILHQLTQPADHPVNIFHPEGEYLKGLVLAVD